MGTTDQLRREREAGLVQQRVEAARPRDEAAEERQWRLVVRALLGWIVGGVWVVAAIALLDALFRQ